MYAMGGTMHGTGLPEREPLKLALTVEQIYAGNVIAAAVMGAHLGALRDGEGQHLDLALFEIMVGNQDRGAQANTTYKYNGNVPHRRGADSTRTISAGWRSKVSTVADSPRARARSCTRRSTAR